MEREDHFTTKLVEEVKNAQISCQITTEIMKEDRDYLNNLLDNFSSACDTLGQEVMRDIRKMQDILRSATELDDPINYYSLLDSLKSYFMEPNSPLMDLMVKTEQLKFKGTQQALKDFLATNKDRMQKFRTISNYLSSELLVLADPGKPNDATSTQLCHFDERDRLASELQGIAPVCPIPESIVPGQMYAALSFERQEWCRAVIGLSTSKFQVGDGPVETLYRCCLLDIGRHERISEKDFRELPSYLKEIPSCAKECALVSASSTSTIRLPKIPYLGELNDHLPKEVISNTPCTKFIPKYTKDELQSRPIQYAAVSIVVAARITQIYVRIDGDEDSALYRQMLDELQEEFRSATRQSSTYCSSPIIGNPYALRLGSEWQRVLIEMMKFSSDKVAFNVDTGHRQTIHSFMEFHHLPEKFMRLPAQSIRCMLYGVFPATSSSLNSHSNEEMKRFLGQHEGKPAVAIFEHWQAGDVGHVKRSAGLGELTARITLYRKDAINSINVLAIRTGLAQSGAEQIELPEHHEIRKRFCDPASAFVPVIRASNRKNSSEVSDLKVVGKTSSMTCIFQPKFGPSDLGSRSPKYAAVIITKAVHPREIYIRFIDEDVPLYRRMLEELQEEFRLASIESDSYCPSPIVGHAYAAKFCGQWSRVIIQITRNGFPEALDIDTGCRQEIPPKTMYHQLPPRFMKLRAQAVRCCLLGVLQPKCPVDGTFYKLFGSKVIDFMGRYSGKQAVAIFNDWKVGQVGDFGKEVALRELVAYDVVLYLNGEEDSINLQVGAHASMARLTSDVIQVPEHMKIRQKLADIISAKLSC